MPRRFAPLLFALLAAISLAVAACGGAPSAPALTDPKEILSKSILALKDVKTLHAQIDLTGSVAADLTGQGSGGKLDLAGTTATLDVDVAGKKVKATGSMPALLNSAAELIVLPDALYYKITGPFAQGDKYTKMAVPADATASEAPTDPTKAITELNDAIAKLPTPPTKAADEKCGDTDCYHVVIKLTSADLQKLEGGSGIPGLTGDLSIDFFSRKDNLRPAKVVVTANGGEQGAVTITTVMTYDQSVAIEAPPADQVQEGGSGLPFPIPSMAP
jgi:hypothetical protein